VERVDTGTYGAKRQSWEDPNPRDLLLRLIKEHPEKTEAGILALFRREVQDNDDYLNPIISYWFANNYLALTAKKKPKEEVQEEREQIRETAKAKLDEHIEREAKIILLDLLLPNGKVLRNCTGRECAKLGPKVGRWLTKISKQIRPNQIVGDTFSEAQIRRLYGR